jgi:hypothetical protein
MANLKVISGAIYAQRATLQYCYTLSYVHTHISPGTVRPLYFSRAFTAMFCDERRAALPDMVARRQGQQRQHAAPRPLIPRVNARRLRAVKQSAPIRLCKSNCSRCRLARAKRSAGAAVAAGLYAAHTVTSRQNGGACRWDEEASGAAGGTDHARCFRHKFENGCACSGDAEATSSCMLPPLAAAT